MYRHGNRSFARASFGIKASVLTLILTGLWYYQSNRGIYFVKTATAAADSTAEQPVQPTPPPKKAKKKLYLTFDDGPDKGTRKVMQIAAAEKIRITLFIVGEHINGSAEQQRIFDSLQIFDNIEIANHSYTHALHNRFVQFYGNPDTVVADFKRNADSLQSTVARTPGRNIWRTDSLRITDLKASTAAADSLYANGYNVVGWDAEWHFNKEQRPVQSAEEMLQLTDSLCKHKKVKTDGHLVILTHDRSFSKPDDSANLHRFIKKIRETDDYEFEWVSNYPHLRKDSLK